MEHKTYYQPVRYYDDGTNIGWGDIPEELASFMVFRTREDCEFWLKDNGYDPGDFAIIEYHDDDIEEVTLIDGDGYFLDGTSSVGAYNTEKDLDEGYDLLQLRIGAAQLATGKKQITIDPCTLYEDDATLGGDDCDYNYRPTIVKIDKNAAYDNEGRIYPLENITDYDDYMMLANAVSFTYYTAYLEVLEDYDDETPDAE